MGFPGGSVIKNPSAMQETQVKSLGWEDPLEKEMANHSGILAWEIHGQRSLVGYSPWGYKELDMTEQLSMYTHNDYYSYLDFFFYYLFASTSLLHSPVLAHYSLC